MNAFSIDHQRTLSVVCLREGEGPAARLRSVGDGYRRLIPNAVAGEETWGSRAAILIDPGYAPDADLTADDIWLQEPALRFWRGLYQRLYSYLGRISPTPQNGYFLIIALQAENFRAAAEVVEQWCRQSGFKEVTIIPSTHALLCRWLTAQTAEAAAERVIATVAVGDTSAAIAAYHVKFGGGRRPHIIASSRQLQISETGLAWWTHRLIGEICKRLREPVQPGFALALRDAAIQFGEQLCRASQDRQVRWSSILQEKMYQPFELSRADCRSWPEVTRLFEELPAAISGATVEVSAQAKADVIVVGGVGATWPFAQDAAQNAGKVWLSNNPQEDIACGAAWWPEIGAYGIEVLQVAGDEKEADAILSSASGTGEEPIVQVDEIWPLWKEIE